MRGMPQAPELISYGFVELYGSSDHDGTMLEIRQGEWIRVRGNVKLQSWPQKPVSARFRGEFWLRRNSFHPHPGGASTQIENLYPNQTPTPWLAVQLLPVLTSNPK